MNVLGNIVNQALHSNQFASGGLLLMAIGAVAAYARKVPDAIKNWIVRQTTIVVTVKDDDQVFAWIKLWFSQQKFTKKTRSVDLDTSINGEISLLPSPGNHWFWWSGRLFRVYFERQINSQSNYGQKRTETFTFVVIGRSRKVIERFVADITKLHRERQKETACLYRYEGSYWEHAHGYAGRELDSIILQDDQKDKLVKDINRFLDAKARYRQLGIPYHRGYLIYGPPGTGKSSLAAALATYLNMGLYVINLNDFNDRRLADAMNKVHPRSVILFEDIDAMGKAVKERPKFADDDDDDELSPPDNPADKMADKFGVTTSGLLNVLDGVDAPSGVIYIMTTNHESTLDQALIRPGRIDYQLHLGNATVDQKIEMHQRFFAEASQDEAWKFVNTHPCNTMAEFQGELLRKEAAMEDESILMAAD